MPGNADRKAEDTGTKFIRGGGMGRDGNFEDLIAWQEARALYREIYKVTRMEKFSKDFALTDQIRRASISILSSIAVGSEWGGCSKFDQFLVVAKGPCGEVRSRL